MTVGYV